ncbi:CPK2 [Symbiodinium natans]|uniref:non-specific serine/threonine protein kinase n=1 Tax=Symbiodinium natans TaxID=878477 RepID=A0A812KYB1_9DINO|nr:CPK2 [Symbiodinium natans]
MQIAAMRWNREALLAFSMSCALIEWHRKRRGGPKLCPLERNDSTDTQCGYGATPSPLLSPLEEDVNASPTSALRKLHRAFPCSPVVCPSPAEFSREDMVRKNDRQVDNEYEFLEVLGEGSFGTVHKARHRRTGILRAVKEIPHAGTANEDFQLELKALQALDHPHIVEVIEYFDDAANFFLIMELCTGPDVFTYVLERMDSPDGDGFVPESEIAVILRQCLKSVLCCHAHGFVHRDLNAKNFMISGEDRTVKLIDFGLATRFQGYLPKDQFIEIVGTSHYMAPEMILDGKYSPAVDIWSLGVLFYVCLTGLMLLPKDDERKKHLLGKKGYVDRKLGKCSQLQKRSCSEQARSLLQSMLQYEPSHRITASEALSHPFILKYCHFYLGGAVEAKTALEPGIIDRLRRFAKAPRLKKVALLFMAHLTEHDEQLLAARHNFRTLDRNGDGEISLEELEAGLSNASIQLPADMAEIFDGCSGHRKGQLHFVEFLACTMPDSLIDERLCHEAFSLLDPDGKGRLTAEDLQAVCPSYELERCEKMVRQAQVAEDGSGSFDFDDFYMFLCGPNSDEASWQLEEGVAERPRKAPRLDTGGDPHPAFIGIPASG